MARTGRQTSDLVLRRCIGAGPAIVALVSRLKSRGRLKPKQIVVAAMRRLLVLCFGVLKTGRPFDAAIAMGG
jgi:hypothetical protein